MTVSESPVEPTGSKLPVESDSSKTRPIFPRRRIRFGLLLTLIGFLVFLVGARPSLFSLDRSPVIGFVQLAVMLVGLAIICISGYLTLAALWPPGAKSIAADIGLRLVATGYLICVFCGMADVFGFGSQPFPKIPYFGPLQALGVEIGELVIATGFMLLIPYSQHVHEEKSQT
jgi:hypothetical protein